MKKGIIIAVIASALMVYVSSCYNNKEDILALPKVSFRGEVVPMVTAGACGCHNNGVGTRAVQFSHLDTIFYDAILSRAPLFDSWVNGGSHPGGGNVDFSHGEKDIIRRWIDEGAKDDGEGSCPAVANPRYTTDIVPIYLTSCKGGSCHGGLGPVLDYARLTTPTNKANLIAMMNSNGANGHPGGKISLSNCTVKIFKDWIAQGQPQ